MFKKLHFSAVCLNQKKVSYFTENILYYLYNFYQSLRNKESFGDITFGITGIDISVVKETLIFLASTSSSL